MKSRIPRPCFCDKTKIYDHLASTITKKKKLILRALRQKSDDGKCDQKKNLCEQKPNWQQRTRRGKPHKDRWQQTPTGD